MEAAKYNADSIAAFFIKRANREFVDENGLYEGITNLKLQKMLYFAQAAHLSMYDEPLFDDEIEAWKFGPVIPGIYNKYKSFQNAPIISDDINFEIDPDTQTFLESIWEIYGKFSAAELVSITHNHQPWKEAYLGSEGENKVINKEMLINYYRGYFTGANNG